LSLRLARTAPGLLLADLTTQRTGSCYVHELGLCEGIVEAAVRRAGDRPVAGLRVRIGGHPVDPGVIAQGVEVAAIGTVVEGAELDLVLEPLVTHCRDCGQGSPVDGATVMAACPKCGGVDIVMTGSEQVILESISVATATATATASPATATGEAGA
jgi:hydrogenase nickel incorporation protein HypA/HybF